MHKIAYGDVADFLSFVKIFLSLQRCHYGQRQLLKLTSLVALYRSSFVPQYDSICCLLIVVLPKVELCETHHPLLWLENEYVEQQLLKKKKMVMKVTIKFKHEK